MKKSLLLCIAAAITAISCEELPNEQRLPINFSLDVQTKASKTTFDEGDKVGIFAVSSNESMKNTGNHYDNIALTKGTDGWTPSQEMTWLDATTPETFYCYYPYNASVEDIHAYSFIVPDDFDSVSNWKEYDFLWGKTNEVAPTLDAIEITTSHLLSYVIIDFSAEQIMEFPVPDADNIEFYVKNVKINNIERGCHINLETGEVTPYNNDKELWIFGSCNITEAHTEGIVIPQTVEDLTFEMEVYRKLGEKLECKTYTWEIGDFTFQAGKIHEIELNLKWPDDIEPVQSFSFNIKNWEDGTGVSQNGYLS